MTQDPKCLWGLSLEEKKNLLVASAQTHTHTHRHGTFQGRRGYDTKRESKGVSSVDPHHSKHFIRK